MPEGAIYVGRPGPWGNPFVVGKNGKADYCVQLYRSLLAGFVLVSTTAEHVEQQRLVRRHAAAHIKELRGHDLACWCRVGQPCHADVLLELANG